MPKTITVLRILVASPSDLQNERELIDGVVRELNLTLPQQHGISLELLKWETNTFPAVGPDPQAVINSQLQDDYDILLAIFWGHIGTATPRSPSGTIEELESAYKRWKSNPDEIRLMVYFKVAPIPVEDIDPDQIRAVKVFRKSLSDRGVLYSTFKSDEEFTQILRVHLSKQVQEFINKPKPKKEPIAAEIIAIPEPQRNIIGSSEEEGFLDLIEIVMISFQRSIEVTKNISDSLKELSAGTELSSHEMQSVTGDERAKFAAYKRISNRQAENMEDFVARIQPEIPILKDSFSKALDAYGRSMILLTDFEKSTENYTQLRNALSAATTLKEAISVSNEKFKGFRTIVAGLPRVTTQFNRAKRDQLETLDTLITLYDSGINRLREIETTGNTLLSSWPAQSLPKDTNPIQ